MAGPYRHRNAYGPFVSFNPGIAVSGSLEILGAITGSNDGLQIGSSLHVTGSISATGAMTLPGLNIDGNTSLTGSLRVGYDASNYTGFTVNSAGELSITSTGGKVGIGTSSPGTKLEIEVADSENSGGLLIDFNETGNYRALQIDSESAYANVISGKFPLNLVSDLSSGYGIRVERNISEAGSLPLANFIDDNTSNTQTTLRIQQDGTGDILNLFDGGTEVFTVLNGGNVGIGVTDPDTLLEILSTSTQLKLSYDATNYATMAVASTGALTITTVHLNGTPADIILVPNGNIGIGTTSPGAQFDVRGPAGTGTASAGVLRLSTAELTVVDADQLGRIEFIAPLESSGTDAILTAAAIYAEAEDTFADDNNKTALVFSTGASAAATEKIRIMSDGNVGIGVSDPDQKLEVGGRIHISSEMAAPSAPSNGDGGILYVKTDGKPYWISNEVGETDLTPQTIGWTDGGTDVYLTTSTDSVGIGTSSPTTKLEIEVADSENIGGLLIDMNETGNYRALQIDSEGAYANEFRGKYPLALLQDLSSGQGLKVQRNINEAGSNPLVEFIDDHTANTATTLRVQQDGTGNILSLFDAATEVFTVKNGGNVGIGYTSAGDIDHKLKVNGNVDFEGTLTVAGKIFGVTDPTGNQHAATKKYVDDEISGVGGGGGAISSYTNSGNNRVITSVNSSTVNGEATLLYDGTTLSVGDAPTESASNGGSTLTANLILNPGAGSNEYNYPCLAMVGDSDNNYWYWTIKSGDLYLYWNFADGNNRDGSGRPSEGVRIADAGNVWISNASFFTGQHRSMPETGTLEDYDDKIGLIIVATGKYNNVGEHGANPDPKLNKPEIYTAHPTIELSNKRHQKNVYGVVAEREGETREHKHGSWIRMDGTTGDDERIILNSLGEGAIWVCNINGNIENGDYITTCEIPGHGMKQDDDILHNYTVAKITQDCNFRINASNYDVEEFEWEGQTYRKAFVGCTYHCG